MENGIWRIRLLGVAGIAACLSLGGISWGCDDSSEAPGERQKSPREEPEDESGEASSSDESAPGPDATSKSEGTQSNELGEGTETQRNKLAKAKTYFMNDQLEEAEPLFEEVVDGGPMSGPRVSAYIALGQIYLQTDRPKQAVDMLESMPPPGENVVEARLVVARAHAQQENTEEAIREFEHVTELQPNYVFAYPVLGSLYARTGRDKKAAETYLKYENRLETMATVLESPDEHGVADRLNILDFLSGVNDERAAEAVRQALADPDPRVRARAAKMTGTMRIVAATQRLEELAASDSVRRVRQRAEASLEKLDDVESPPDRRSGFPESARPDSGN